MADNQVDMIVNGPLAKGSSLSVRKIYANESQLKKNYARKKINPLYLKK